MWWNFGRLSCQGNLRCGFRNRLTVVRQRGQREHCAAFRARHFASSGRGKDLGGNLELDLAAGTVLERYTVERTLGAGGMAVVYLARHNQIGSLHAVKVLTVHGQVIRERLLQEGRVQAGLRHPNIVSVHRFGIDEEVGPWIAMELEGRSLKHFIGDEPAEPDQVRVLLRDVLRGLVVVHGAEPPILHRDLKPSNILSTAFGLWKVVDFGLAKRRGADETLNLVTVQYAAPELMDSTLGCFACKRHKCLATSLAVSADINLDTDR